MPEIPVITGKIVGSMATYPGRFASIERVIASLMPQLDVLYVYVNETTEGFPDVSAYPGCIVIDGREHLGDMSANGKIYPLDFIHDSFVFTLDDDFVYPPDYVSRKIEILERFDLKCCVATHGSILPRHCDWYYERTHVFISRRGLPAIQAVSLAGSGTLAFHQKTLTAKTADFLPDVMVDLRFSLLAKEQGLPIWCIDREEFWLEHIPGDGLFQTYVAEAITHHTVHARVEDWSFESYLDIYREALGGLAPEQTADFSPEFLQCVADGTEPGVWRNTLNCYVRRKQFLESVLPEAQADE